MSQHEEYQQRCLVGLRRIVDMPEGDFNTMLQALIEKQEWAYATELLFGTDRRDEFHQLDSIGWWVYLAFYIGKFPRPFFQEVVSHHHWSDKPVAGPNAGFSIAVYPNEYFVIHEPFATAVLRSVYD